MIRSVIFMQLVNEFKSGEVINVLARMRMCKQKNDRHLEHLKGTNKRILQALPPLHWA